jgi:hypothetical protein
MTRPKKPKKRMELQEIDTPIGGEKGANAMFFNNR